MSEGAKKEAAAKQIEQLRSILVRPEIAEHDREKQSKLQSDVSEVITQAMVAREQQDGSVSANLAPYIQKSVKHAMLSQKTEFTNAMFPLVGALVRKYVTVLLRDFIEKTNQMLENSLSVKGLKWRFHAWRAGMPYAKYVISQTYVYQIEQVLLIHRETGALLNAVSLLQEDSENSVLVSSMLSAINDFVGDSFSKDSAQQEQQLDEIKTDELSLLLIQGPNAMLVAAVNGNISPNAKLFLREAIETLHQQFDMQFKAFNGDTQALAGTTELLESCLLSQEKDDHEGANKQGKKRKTPVFAVLVLIVAAGALGYWWYLHWQTEQAATRLDAISASASAGSIVPISIEKQGIHDILFRYLQPSDADNTEISMLIDAAKVSSDWVQLQAYPVLSKSSRAFDEKLTYILSLLPALSFDEDSRSLIGQLSTQEYDQLVVLSAALEASSGLSLDLSKLEITSNVDIDDRAMSLQALEQLSSQISQYQVDFDISSDIIADSEQNKLEMIAQRFKTIRTLAASVDKRSYLLIIGSSDNSGALNTNIELSKTRAESVTQALIKLGIDQDEILSTGVLPVDVDGREVNARKTLVTVIHSDATRKQ